MKLKKIWSSPSNYWVKSTLYGGYEKGGFHFCLEENDSRRPYLEYIYELDCFTPLAIVPYRITSGIYSDFKKYGVYIDYRDLNESITNFVGAVRI